MNFVDISFYHYDSLTGQVITLPETTVSVRRVDRTVLEKKRAEDVAFRPVVGETLDGSNARARGFFREVYGTVTVDPTEFTPIEDIVHPGVGGDVGNSFDGDAWGLEDVVDTTRDQASRAAVNVLQLKFSAANIAPPGNPTQIVSLASFGLDHRAAVLHSAAEIVSIKSQLTDAKTLVNEFTGESAELGQIRERMSVAVSNEAQAQANTSQAMYLLVRAETRLVALERDLELRDTRCTLVTNEAASLRVEVLKLGQQLVSAGTSAARFHQCIPSLITSIHESIQTELSEASVRTFQSTADALATLTLLVGEVTSAMQDRTLHSAPTTGSSSAPPPSWCTS